MSVRRGEGEVAYRFHGELSVKRNVQMWRQLCGSRESDEDLVRKALANAFLAVPVPGFVDSAVSPYVFVLVVARFSFLCFFFFFS